MQEPVYIYHCSDDNKSEPTHSMEWVTTFAHFLNPILTEMIGDEIKVKLIDEDSSSSPSITADILLIILSPNLIAL